MAYDYKPGEDQDVLKNFMIIGGLVVLLAIGVVLTLYLGLGIDIEMM